MHTGDLNAHRSQASIGAVSVRLIAGERVGAPRGEAVVCVPWVDGPDLEACLGGLVRHTPVDVPVVVSDVAAGAAGRDELARLFKELGSDGHQFFHLSASESHDLAALIDAAVVAAAPADVAVVVPGCVVSDGWYEGLRAAAAADSTVATAGTLTTENLGLPTVDMGAGSETGLDPLAAAVRARSPHTLPRVLPAGRGCVYVKRSAVELVGEVGSAWTSDGSRPDFFVRCLGRGLCHVIADDVIVSSTRFATGTDGRYEDVTLPLARSLSAARRATEGLSLLIDARILGRQITGTQVHVLELIGALARTNQVRIRALVSNELGGDADRALERLTAVELVGVESTSGLAPADLVHRPFQVSNEADLRLLRGLGERLVVTNQDLIGYRNPSYFSSRREWDEYRRLTRRALAVADHVVFFSAHALQDALAEDMVDSGHSTVVPIGVDHSLHLDEQTPLAPSEAGRLPEQSEVLLCLGTNLRHKNRLFALQVLEQLQQRHSWDGYLVFAGPHVPIGSSAREEAEVLARAPSLAERTIDARSVEEPEKLWLLGRADLVLYPTVYEGFGLVPFEAAEHDVPCMWAPVSSLQEILPADQATIVPWDAHATADGAISLLRDNAAASRSVAGVRTVGASLTWDATAERLLEIYQRTCDEPASAAGAVDRMAPAAAVTEDGLRLVGPGGALAPDLERPLLALATHPRIGAPVFGALKAGYRASHFVNRITGRARSRARTASPSGPRRHSGRG